MADQNIQQLIDDAVNGNREDAVHSAVILGKLVVGERQATRIVDQKIRYFQKYLRYVVDNKIDVSNLDVLLQFNEKFNL